MQRCFNYKTYFDARRTLRHSNWGLIHWEDFTFGAIKENLLSGRISLIEKNEFNPPNNAAVLGAEWKLEETKVIFKC